MGALWVNAYGMFICWRTREPGTRMKEFEEAKDGSKKDDRVRRRRDAMIFELLR